MAAFLTPLTQPLGVLQTPAALVQTRRVYVIGCRTEHKSGAQKVQRHSNLQTTYNFGNVSKIMKNTSWTNLFTSEVQEIPNDGSSELAHSGGGQIHLTIIRAMMIKSGGEGRGGEGGEGEQTGTAEQKPRAHNCYGLCLLTKYGPVKCQHGCTMN